MTRLGLAAALAAGAVPPAFASSITLSSASGQWVDAVTAPPIDGVPTSVVLLDDATGAGTDSVSWGDYYVTDNGPLFYGSGYTFTPTSDIADIGLDTPFLLGTFMHLNRPIPSNGIASVDYALSFDLTGLVSPPLDVLLHFDHNETWNVAGACPSGSTSVCDDVVTTSLPGTSMFSLDSGTKYFQLLGFSQNGGLTFSSQYFSPEGGSNTAMLYGMVSSDPAPIPNPEPATLALFGTGLVAAIAVRRRARRASHSVQ